MYTDERFYDSQAVSHSTMELPMVRSVVFPSFEQTENRVGIFANTLFFDHVFLATDWHGSSRMVRLVRGDQDCPVEYLIREDPCQSVPKKTRI